VADHQLHALVPGFADVADDYERGRPDYPPAFVPAVAAHARIAPGARVLDLAAGTGKLTRALLAAGFDVVAVEPLAGMRERLAATLPADRILDGSAEALPLPGASVDAVFCGDAFHWFDGPAALSEIARVLRPGGALVLSWLVPQSAGEQSWWPRVSAILDAVRPEHPGYAPDRGMAAIDAHSGFSPRESVPVPFEHTTDVAGLCAYVASLSYVGAMTPPARASLLADVAATVAGDPLPLRAASVADAWVTTRRA
jgi:SAM-dependent methyltransferase